MTVFIKNIKNFLLKHKHSIFFLFFSFLFSILLMSLMQNNCFWDDDPKYGILHNYRLLNTLNFSIEHGSGYPGLFLFKFLCFWLPVKLNIHPSDFIVSPFYLGLKSLFIILIIFLFSGFFGFYNNSKTKNKTSLLIFYMFTVCYFLYSLFTSQSFILKVNYAFYRYCLSLLLFYFMIFYILNSIFYPNKKTNIFYHIFAVFSAYSVGASSEMLIITSLVFYILIFIYNFIFKTVKFKVSFYLPFIALVISSFLFLTSFELCYNATVYRGVGHTVTLTELIKFLKFYYILMFKNEILNWLTCLILVFISFKYFRKQFGKECIIIPFFLQLSILTAYFSLLFCGETGTYSILQNCNFFLSHKNLLFLYKMIILLPFILYFSNFLNLIKTKTLIYKSTISVFIISIFIMSFANLKLYYKYIANTELSEIRKSLYVAEKLYVFQILNNIKPVLYLAIGEFNRASVFNAYYNSIHKNHPYKISQDNHIVDINSNQTDVCKKLGMIVSEEEIKDMKFSRLLDDDFVLGKKQIKQIKK